MLVLKKCKVCGNDRMHINEFKEEFCVICLDCLSSTEEVYPSRQEAISAWEEENEGEENE